MRNQPNIVITGTPGVGKTTHCELLVKNSGLKHLSVNDIAKENDCYDGYDEELKTHFIDEDKLLDILMPMLETGGTIVDYHACDLFPSRLIDLVVVLRCDTATLYDRLTARNYSSKKLEENMDAEIMQVLLEEAREAFEEEIVVELSSNDSEDVDSNVDRVEKWLAAWVEERKKRGDDE